jgi:hypothetical protein
VSVGQCIALLIRAETCVGYNCFLGLSAKSSDLPWYSRRWTRSAAAAAGSRTRSSYWNRL